MGTVLSGLSLLMALAIAAALLALAPRDPTRIRLGWPRSRFRPRSSAGALGASGRAHALASSGSRRGRFSTYSTLGNAFNLTLGAALFLVTGLIGFHLDRYRSAAGSRWSEGYIWWQVLLGLVLACLAAFFWRKGLREIRSNALLPEVVGGPRDTRLPPSRRIP